MPSLAKQKRQDFSGAKNLLHHQSHHNYKDRDITPHRPDKEVTRSVTANPLSFSPKKAQYLHWIVKNFTFCDGLSRFQRRWYLFRRMSSQKRTPHRTVRCVHVMPWGTQIRRIGCTRVNIFGQDGDDPANSGGRRA